MDLITQLCHDFLANVINIVGMTVGAFVANWLQELAKNKRLGRFQTVTAIMVQAVMQTVAKADRPGAKEALVVKLKSKFPEYDSEMISAGIEAAVLAAKQTASTAVVITTPATAVVNTPGSADLHDL